ncbi:hypothetical protein GCM10023349_25260 [Nocardioides conyzicola]|uniref:Uncharacterized protein n=1 Tax=Nocardioides conyzicola TaxID=1651781 RepID=A0ABP8XG24_9ACTN
MLAPVADGSRSMTTYRPAFRVTPGELPPVAADADSRGTPASRAARTAPVDTAPRIRRDRELLADAHPENVTASPKVTKVV